MNPETALQQRILAEEGASETHRLWRNATGLYYAGTIIGRGARIRTIVARGELYPGDVLLRGSTPIRAGLCEGSADLVGISNGGLFTGIELKVPGKNAQPHQARWLEVVSSLGGIVGVARSPEDVRAILERGR